MNYFIKNFTIGECSLFPTLDNWQNQKLYFIKNYDIIKLGYKYKVTMKYDVNGNEQTKKSNTHEKAIFSAEFEFFVEGRCQTFDEACLGLTIKVFRSKKQGYP